MASGIFNFEPLWGEWYIDELIGKGSYGEVDRIHKDVEGVRVEAAVKYISIPKAEDKRSYRLYTQEELVTLFDERADKFSVEISSMLKLRDSANVVRYEDHIKQHKANDIGWDIIIRMELLTSLEDYLDDNNFSGQDVAKLGIDICSAISWCQANDIIHRDIKIENIFVDSHGNYKLGDFGVSKVGSGTATGTVTGTEDYMAPEISQEHKYNKTVDIYALGIAMYQMLNNRRKPFIDADCVPGQDAEAQAHLKRIKGEQMPPPKYATEELARIVLKACAYDRHARYSSPDEMAEDLRNIFPSLSADAVLKARGRREFYPTDEQIRSSTGGDTLSDISESARMSNQTVSDTPVGNRGGGTISDIPQAERANNQTISDTPGRAEANGTVRDLAPPPQQKKKSKKGFLIWMIVILLLIGSGTAAYFLLTGSEEAQVITAQEILGLPAETVQIVAGDTHQLNPQIMPEGAVGELIYSSDDESVATVSETGLITTHAVGEVNITVQADEVIETVHVNITAKRVPVENILGVTSNAELIVDSSLTINAYVQPADATVQQVTYSSSDESIATVGPDGVVTAISPGTVIITVSADDVIKEMELTVKAKAVTPTTRPYTPPKTSTPTHTEPVVEVAPVVEPVVEVAPSTPEVNTNTGGGNNISGYEIANPDPNKYD